jgi:hypothetical protein
MGQYSVKYMELFVIDYYVPTSTSTNATSQLLRVFNGRATAHGRSNTRECGSKTTMSSQHPAPFGCVSYADATVLSCSICSFKVESNNDYKWKSEKSNFNEMLLSSLTVLSCPVNLFIDKLLRALLICCNENS